MHPATEAILRYFEYGHLPQRLQEVSQPFYDLAHAAARAGDGPEVTAGLRKLLEAKDCFVRAALPPARDPALYGDGTAPSGDVHIHEAPSGLREPEDGCDICGALPGEPHDGNAHGYTDVAQ